MKKLIIFIPLILCFLPPFQNIYAQDYFPLEVGNRWDYFVEIHIPGGFTSYDTSSIQIEDQQIMPNGLEYFVLSETLFNNFFPRSKYLRKENNKYYYYNEDDSTDCFYLRFDLPTDSFYLDCMGGQWDVDSYVNTYTFGFSDTLQYQNIEYVFSKHFGGYSFTDHWVATYYFTLKGCIISGVTYGNLLVDVQDEIKTPIKFELSQNYPNPFNPATKIKYQIPETEKVTLKIFDVLGNEISTLVNEEKPAGKYEADFIGNTLTSGIYFYQLKTGNFIEMKKMILLK